VVALLLEKDTDIGVEDSEGRTLLAWAAFNGDKAIVKLLLEKGTVDRNTKILLAGRHCHLRLRMDTSRWSWRFIPGMPSIPIRNIITAQRHYH
jgi:ankyrin repeat protein